MSSNMKKALYAFVFTLLIIKTEQMPDSIHLLPLDILAKYGVPPDFTSNYFALNFTGSHIKIPITELECADSTITSPYLIEMAFKLSKSVPSYMFSIEDNTNIKMMVHFEPFGTNNTQTILTFSDNKISFRTENLVGKQHTIYIHVLDNEVVLYECCNETGRLKVPGRKHVEFSKNAILNLGNTIMNPTQQSFDGTISKLSIYPMGGKSMLMRLCRNPLQMLEKLLAERKKIHLSGLKGDAEKGVIIGAPRSPGNDGRDGKKGDKGDTGNTGAPGEPGRPASLSDILDTSVLDPEKRAEIIEKLKGSKGDIGLTGKEGAKGDRGEQGKTGATGSTGKPGATGKTGPKGAKGDKGPIGATGPAGQAGFKGTTREKGQKGDDAPPINVAMLRGEKCDKGEPGIPLNDGKPGPQGPPEMCSKCNNFTSVIGPPGPPGRRGLPGLSIVGPQGEPCRHVWENVSFDNSFKGFRDDDEVVTTNTIMVRNKRALLKHTPQTPIGTMAYVLQENIFLIRVFQGWQYIMMGDLLTNDAEESKTGAPTPNGSINHPTSSTTSPGHPTLSESQTPSSYTVKPTYLDNHGTYLLPKDAIELSTQTFQLSLSINRTMVTTQAPTTYQTLRPPSPLNTSHATYSNNYIRLAALNDPYPGRPYLQKGFSSNAADRLCNKQGTKYKHGNFRAFLSSRITNVKTLVKKKDRELPVKNLHGDLLFNSWNSIFDGSTFINNPVNIYSFNNENVMVHPHWPRKAMWHGSDTHGHRNLKSMCNEWDSTSHSVYGTASSLTSGWLLNQELFSCDTKLIILCVEISASAARSRRQSRRRRMRAARGRGGGSSSTVVETIVGTL